MKNKYQIKHLHQDVGLFNGPLFFEIDNKLLEVFVNTPHFNDYGEWCLKTFRLATEPYDPSANTVELNPFEFSSIEINQLDYDFLVEASKFINEENSSADFMSKYPDFNEELVGGFSREDNDFIIRNDSDEDNIFHIPYSNWQKKSDKTSFEKIFYPILKQFRDGYKKKM